MPAQYRPLADDVPPVTADEYRRALARLGINNSQAGDLFGISAVTSRRFSTGSQAVPGPLGRLVRLIEAQRLTVDQLRTWFDYKWEPVGDPRVRPSHKWPPAGDA